MIIIATHLCSIQEYNLYDAYDAEEHHESKTTLFCKIL